MSNKRVNLASGGRLGGSRNSRFNFESSQNVTPTIGTQSVSGPSGPSKAAPSVNYSESNLGTGDVKTITDGKTKVTQSSNSAIEHIYGGNPDISKALRQDYFNRHQQWPPCINTSCKSYGKPHPNCLCYGAMEVQPMAQGGEVCSSNLSHHEKCEHFADGGQVVENNVIQSDPLTTLDNVAVHHGLLGLLTKVGHSKSEQPHKHFEDYVTSFRKGNKSVIGHMDKLFEPHVVEVDKNSRESLKSHLQFLRENPEKMLEVGGSLGSNLPDHAVHLASKIGTAANYFDSIKPTQSKNSPLDEITPIDKMAEAKYNRQLDIAQNPLIILNHTKDGTLMPDDIKTLGALYPTLHKRIISKTFEQIVNAKAKNVDIPYKKKQSLSLLLGQALDSTMTPMAMQAIIKSQGPQQAQQQQRNQPKKASGVELKQINKVNDLYKTPLERRQTSRK